MKFPKSRFPIRVMNTLSGDLTMFVVRIRLENDPLKEEVGNILREWWWGDERFKYPLSLTELQKTPRMLISIRIDLKEPISTDPEIPIRLLDLFQLVEEKLSPIVEITLRTK